MNHESPLHIPAEERLKDAPCIGCSDPDCDARAPFTIREFEYDSTAAQLATGWQLRMIITVVISDDGPGQAWRWDFFCPEHAGVWDPRPDRSWRVRSRDPETS